MGLCFLGRVNIIHHQRLDTDFEYWRVNMNDPSYQCSMQSSNPQVLSGCRQGFSTCREPVLKCVFFNCKALLPCLKQAGAGLSAAR